MANDLRRGNLFVHGPVPATGEDMVDLLRHGPLQIERIVSSSTPDPGVYEQSQDEWVLLVRGGAVLRVDKEIVTLVAGDYIFLKAGLRHEVLSTKKQTLWLTVHLHPSSPVAAPEGPEPFTLQVCLCLIAPAYVSLISVPRYEHLESVHQPKGPRQCSSRSTSTT